MTASFIDNTTGNQYSFSEEQLAELGPFEPDASHIDRLGTWKMRMKDGLLFIAWGTVRDYDNIVKILIHRKLIFEAFHQEPDVPKYIFPRRTGQE